MLVSDLKKTIREVPDFPRAGINFYDLTTLFRSPEAFRSAAEKLVERYRGERIEALVGIEARGFVVASVMAWELGAGLILARKSGKLPCEVEREEYALEYGSAAVEIHRDAVHPGHRILIVDDLLATGGTAAAAGRIVERLGGKVEGYAFLVELSFLRGRAKLPSENVFSLIQYGG